jgi:hypothetical protein
LDNPTDFVRLEIEAALARDIPVVPVLVRGTQMPALEELPETFEDFVHGNAVELSDGRWSYDVARLTNGSRVSQRRSHVDRKPGSFVPVRQ